MLYQIFKANCKLILSAILLIPSCVIAQTYTATSNGDWSSGATWQGGTAPGNVIGANQTVKIDSNVNVNLDQAVTIDHSTAYISVDGTLQGNGKLEIKAGDLKGSGSGVVDIDRLIIGTTRAVPLNGVTKANVVSVDTIFVVCNHLKANDTLYLNSDLTSLPLGDCAGANFDIADGAVIVSDGGNFSGPGAGLFNPLGDYNLIYRGGSLNEFGLINKNNHPKNVRLNLNNKDDTLELFENSTIKNKLALQQGHLKLTGDTLSIGDTLQVDHGDVATFSNGKLAIQNNGKIFINGNKGLSSLVGQGAYDVTYQGNSKQAGAELSNPRNVNLMMAHDTSNIALTTNATINNLLALQKSFLDINGAHLKILGDLTSNNNARFAGSAASDLTINTNSKLSSSIEFKSARDTVNDLVFNVGAGNEVTLDSDLSIQGDFEPQNGYLDFKGNKLTLKGDWASGANGKVAANASSDLVIANTGSFSGNLAFTNNGNTVNDFTVNLNSNSEQVALGTEVNVNGDLALQQGQLGLNGNNLYLNGNMAGGGSGSLSANGNASVIANSNQSFEGPLRMTQGNQTLQDLEVDLPVNDTLALGSDLVLSNELRTKGGELTLNGHRLEIQGNISSTSSGTLSGDANAELALNTSGSLNGALKFTQGQARLGTFDVNVGSQNEAKLGSDLTIHSELMLDQGQLMIGDQNLHLDSNAVINGQAASSYVVTNGNGTLNRMLYNQDTGIYPVGTAANYSPARINHQANNAVEYGIDVKSGVKANGTSGSDLANSQSLVDQTWFVNASSNANVNMDLRLEWVPDLEVNNFDFNNCYVTHYMNGSWDTRSGESAKVTDQSTFYIERDGIQSPGPFAVREDTSTTGLETASFQNDEPKIHPNPVQDEISIQAKGGHFDHVAIYSSTGKLLRSQPVSSKQNAFSIKNLEKGLYILRLTGDHYQATTKFMKR